jgi:1-deoxy-D-xylulose-5-phosphate reductoisomerase
MKRLLILGSTGSIGTSCLDVVAANSDRFAVAGLAACSSVAALCDQADRFTPDAVALTNPDAASSVRTHLGADSRVYEGLDGMLAMIREVPCDAVVNGLVGSVGLVPTLTALEMGLDVLLANKETIVMGGELVTAAAERSRGRIVPIDSEMSAIYQCLNGEDPAHVKRLVLTASGGPFVDFSAEQIASVTVEQALDHPTWAMGTKNTIDSATLMNKGLEVIEASLLFGVPGDRIDVTVHRTSVSHSFVEFIDGSLLTQVSMPDMRLAIQYAMTAPERLPSPYGGLDFTHTFSLVFEPPDLERFPCLRLAYTSLAQGGTAPAAVNGANEEAVEAFVAGRIEFMDIPKLIETALERHNHRSSPTVDHLIETDIAAKRLIRELTAG